MVNRLWGTTLAALAVLALTVSVGCSDEDTEEPVQPKADAESKVDATLCDVKERKVQTYDLNKDNKPDVWKLYRIETENNARIQVLTCKQIDFNYDGKKDIVTGYNRLGSKEFEKADLDFDGRFDAFYLYDKNGNKREVHRDSDFDGKFDSKEIWTEKGLKSIRRDRNDDQEPDVWEQYVGGKLVAILYDEDFDGKVDRREDAGDAEDAKPKKEQPKSEAPKDGDNPEGEQPAEDKPAGEGDKKPDEADGADDKE